jgi:hypothetical protein
VSTVAPKPTRRRQWPRISCVGQSHTIVLADALFEEDGDGEAEEKDEEAEDDGKGFCGVNVCARSADVQF